MDMTSYLLGKQAGGGTIVETDPIYSSSPASEITAEDITNWNNKSDFSGNYNDLTNKPTIPEAVQYSTIPTASVDNLGKIVQFIGTTDSTYTNGYFYKCVSDGQDPATYSWENVDVMNAGGGSSYTAGTNINIDSNNAINCSIPYSMGSDTSANFHGNGIGTSQQTIGSMANAIGNSASAAERAVVVGHIANAAYRCTAIGALTSASLTNSIAIGDSANADAAYSIVIGNNANSSHVGGIAIGTNAMTTKISQAIIGSSNYPINYLTIRTSQGEKDLATEEFVTNYLTTLSTYDATKTQVLKNVSGTLTWVTEE